MKGVLRETVAVLAAGILLGLMANLLSPRGLALGRNYFPGVRGAAPLPPAPIQTNLAQGVQTGAAATNATGTNQAAVLTAAMVEARLKENGLQIGDSNRVVELYRDPRFAQEAIIFVDAREDREYQEGHVPAAYQFYHYRAADYLAGVLAASQTAEQIVIYCNGGNCEDSLFAAIMLRDAGVPAAKLLVYTGGMMEWAANGLPVELGARRSGQMKGGTR